jgi:hypothetical protein
MNSAADKCSVTFLIYGSVIPACAGMTDRVNDEERRILLSNTKSQMSQRDRSPEGAQ